MNANTIARIKKFFTSFSTHAILVAVAMTCLFPVFWMISSSLKTQDEIFTKMNLIPEKVHVGNYQEAWTKAEFWKYFLNSVIYTVAGVAGIVFISSLAAYGFARLEMWGKNIFFYLLISTLLIPIPGVFVPLYLLLNKLGLLDTRTGLILCYISGNLAFGIFLLRSFFEELPREIEERPLSTAPHASAYTGGSRFHWRGRPSQRSSSLIR
jgi:ABC-type glycerol-3-phosphate transport system permease component